jgi:predicted flap endonuclease-1-like 5' DNA nuclease
MHYPSHIDIGVYVGTIGLFFVFFLLFARFFPVLALNELKSILKSSGESYKNGDAGHHHPTPTPVAEAPAIEEKVEEIASDVASDATDLLSVVGTASVDNADDLKAITGVGPVLETALNEIGIYTYEQISKMTKREYDIMDEMTGKSAGKAEKDDWAGQAKELMNKSNNQ